MRAAIFALIFFCVAVGVVKKCDALGPPPGVYIVICPFATVPEPIAESSTCQKESESSKENSGGLEYVEPKENVRQVIKNWINSESNP